MKSVANPRGTLIFIGLAVVMMVLIHFVKNGGSLMPRQEDAAVTETRQIIQDSARSMPDDELTEAQFAEIMSFYSYGPRMDEFSRAFDYPNMDEAKPKQAVIAKKAPAYEPLVVEGNPKIAIIIDDMGVDRRRSLQTLEIDAPLTLAFLPYAESLDSITSAAQDKGHELMIHMPMQAMTNPVSLGPIALKSGMGEAEVKANMEAAFESFSGYEGINNHMGSRVTQDSQIMDWAMEAIQERGLYFVDSKTIGSSVAAKTAMLNGLPTATRDVFLDHESTPEFVAQALRKTERVAAKQGYAIAIGHPKDATINGLREWIPDAEARGFEIVHASELVARPQSSAQIAAVQKKEAPPAVQNTRVTEEPYVEEETVEFENSVGVMARIKPAAGGLYEVDEQDAEAIMDQDDPNSPDAREAILKRMLGQMPEITPEEPEHFNP